MWSARQFFNSCDCASSPPPSRRRDLFELLGAYFLILLVIWTPRPWQWPLWGLSAIAITLLFALSSQTLKTLGFCSANLLRSLWAVALASMLAFAAILLAGHYHTLHTPVSLPLFFRHYGAYAIWAGIQQLILQGFFFARCLRLLPSSTAAAGVSAGLFAIAHLPNPVLTIITLVFGLASCLFYLHYRNLWPLAIAHAILGISIAITVPGYLLHNMRVGIGYLHYVSRPVLSQTSGPARITLLAKP